MENRPSRGDPERLGAIILRCVEAAQAKGFYRPHRPFSHKRRKQKPTEAKTQLVFKFTEEVRDRQRPLRDIFPEAYAE